MIAKKLVQYCTITLHVHVKQQKTNGFSISSHFDKYWIDFQFFEMLQWLFLTPQLSLLLLLLQIRGIKIIAAKVNFAGPQLNWKTASCSRYTLSVQKKSVKSDKKICKYLQVTGSSPNQNFPRFIFT